MDVTEVFHGGISLELSVAGYHSRCIKEFNRSPDKRQLCVLSHSVD